MAWFKKRLRKVTLPPTVDSLSCARLGLHSALTGGAGGVMMLSNTSLAELLGPWSIFTTLSAVVAYVWFVSFYGTRKIQSILAAYRAAVLNEVKVTHE